MGLLQVNPLHPSSAPRIRQPKAGALPEAEAKDDLEADALDASGAEAAAAELAELGGGDLGDEEGFLRDLQVNSS